MEASDVPPALRERLGGEATVGLLGLFATARQEWMPDVTTAAVERFERRLGEETGLLRGEIVALRLEMREGFATLREAMHAGDAALQQAMQAGEAALQQAVQAGDAALQQAMQAGDAALQQEVQAGDAALQQEVHAGDASLREEMLAGFASLRQQNADARFELLKWCFAFWVGQVFAVAGVVAVVLRLMR